MKTIEIIEVENKTMVEQFNVYVDNVIDQNDNFHSNPIINSVCKSIDFESYDTASGTNKMFLKSISGNGNVDFIRFDNQLNVINFDACFNEDLVIDISHKKDTLYFFYILEGECFHSLNTSENLFKVDALKTFSFMACKSNHNQLIIKKGIPFKCNIISIDKDTYLKNFVINLSITNGPLNNLYTIFESLKEQQLACLYSLNISKELRIIETELINECVTSTLGLLSRYQLILSQHMEHVFTITFNKGIGYNISCSEIKKIRTITNHILENPGLNHSQEQLCSQFFVSQPKLQAGFKAVHKTTVSNFTRNVRLEKSEELLSNSELNISEIVYSVGFTSRSYFSKIFKQKFDCNPTTYRTQFIQDFQTLTS